MSLQPIDKNWERWIWASIFKFFKDQNDALTPSYKLYREGEQRKTSVQETFLELRIDGPKFKTTPSFYHIEVDVNVLIQLQQDKDLYHPNKMSSDVCVILMNNIAILKLGNQPSDDGSLVACLRVDDATGIVAHKYGIVEPSLPVLQASVSTKYWVDLPD